MKYMGLPANAPRSQRKAFRARQKRRDTWMPGLQAAMRRNNRGTRLLR